MRLFCQNCRRDVEIDPNQTGNALVCSECGRYITTPGLPRGTILSGFEIEDEIGRGGMGIVYRASQINLERQVALKVLSDELSQDLEFVDQFFKEARSAGGLSHPNIVQAYDAGATPDGLYYLAMELIEGETLENRINREGLITPKSATLIALKIANALNYAWEKNKLAHGDIKPENIILDSSGGIKLADLGLAKSAHEDHSDWADFATPLYAPPELIRGDSNLSLSRADMYSYGVTLYHMLAGSPPFPDDDPETVMKRHLNEAPEPLSKHNKNIHHDFAKLVDQLLSKNPSDRPKSWADVIKTIERTFKPEKKIIKRSAKSARVSQKFETTKIESSGIVKLAKHLAWIALILALLIVFYLLGIWHGGRNSQKKHGASQTVDLKNKTLNEFGKLKTSIKFIPLDQQIKKIEVFIGKAGDSCPKEIRQYAAGLKSKRNKQEIELKNQKRVIRQFTEKKLSVLELLDQNPILSKVPIEKLREISSETDILLKIHRKYPYIQDMMSKVETTLIHNRFIEAGTLIDDQERQIREAKAAADLAEKEKAERQRLAQEKAKKQAQQRRKQLKEGRQQAVIDYKNMLVDFLGASTKERNSENICERFQKWRGKYPQFSKLVASKSNFLLEQFQDVNSDIFSFLSTKVDLFKGKTLPPKVIPKNIENYIVEDISKDELKLTHSVSKDGGGEIKSVKRIKWSKMSATDLGKILTRTFLDKKTATKLPINEQKTIIYFFLSNGQELRLQENFDAFSDEIQNDKDKWSNLINDFIVASSEAKAQKLFNKFVESQKSTKGSTKAADCLANLLMDYPKSDTVRKLMKEDSMLMQKFLEYSPTLQALNVVKKSNAALVGDKAKQALSLAMVADSRYGKNKTVNEKLLEKIIANKTTALTIIKGKTPAQKLSDNRIPFYHWENYPPGTVTIFDSFINSDQDFQQKYSDYDAKPLNLAAAINRGDWRSVQDIYSNSKSKSIPWLQKGSDDFHFWKPALLFGYGLVADQLGDLKTRSEILSSLLKIANDNKTNESDLSPLSAYVAGEYSVICGVPETTLDFIRVYNFEKSCGQELNGKIALMYLSLILQNKTVDSELFAKKLDQFQSMPFFKDLAATDLNWCKTAIAILNGNCELDEKQLTDLTSGKLLEKDLCARILLDALIIASHRGQSPKSGIEKLEEIIANQIENRIMSGFLWKKYWIYKIARAGTPAAMSSELANALKDLRYCTLLSYPKLLALKAGIDSFRNEDQREIIKKSYSRFINATFLAPKEMKSSSSMLSSKDSPRKLEKIFSKPLPESAFWIGVMSLISSADNAKSNATLKILNAYSNCYQWEERFLLQSISNIIEKYNK